MKHKVYIFDFDGTLVHSNQLKRDAFYEISEEVTANRRVVDEVLAAIPDRSRFEIIDRIYAGLEPTTGKGKSREAIIEKAVTKYSKIVREGVLACPELEGATALLATIFTNGGIIFVSSNTPGEFLGELINARGWDRYIQDYFGFPRQKGDTVGHILMSLNLTPASVLVIGDGISDKMAAHQNGCDYYEITDSKSILNLGALIS